jgi:hypothetical protein
MPAGGTVESGVTSEVDTVEPIQVTRLGGSETGDSYRMKSQTDIHTTVPDISSQFEQSMEVFTALFRECINGAFKYLGMIVAYNLAIPW